jgi:hypothetical protein
MSAIPKWFLLELVEPMLWKSEEYVRDWRDNVANYARWKTSPDWATVWKEDHDRAVRSLQAVERRHRHLVAYAKTLKAKPLAKRPTRAR